MKQTTLFADPDPATAGLTCRGCSGVECATHWDNLPTGERVIRLTCNACGRFLRHLLPEGGCVFQPKPADAHSTEQQAPGSGWQWVGLIRSADGVWRPVALTDDLKSCWDCLLTSWMTGDRMTVPVRRGACADEGGGDGFTMRN